MPTIAQIRLSSSLVLAFLLAAARGFAQSQTVSITTILDQVITSTDSAANFEFTGLRIEPARNLYQYLSEKYPDLATPAGSFEIPHPIYFSNCAFSRELILKNLSFQELSFSSCTLDNLDISNCSIAGIRLEGNTVSNAIQITGSRLAGLDMKENQVDYEVYMEKDSIHGDTYIENNRINKGEFGMSGIAFGGSVTIGNNQVSGVLIENSRFALPPFGEFNNYKLPGDDPSDLYLTGNEFTGDTTSKVYFNKGNYLNLDLRDNRFFTNVYFIENHVNDRFFLVGNEFSHHVSFEKFLFSETWNELYWDQLAGYKIHYVDYAGKSEQELEDDVKFKNLINIYKGMHTIFLSRGDLQSANACYSEMKQLQGRMLRHIYFREGGFGNLLRWGLNVLLKIYTDHGTDPGLAVVVSFFVILGFAALYLFFPSEWDSDSLRRLLTSYEQFLHRKKTGSVTPFLVVVGSGLLTLVNALTLSINSFVTLGFGSIPTRGFARYLCIIEGFIGWFLLSIFTVALINQVLA